MATHEVDDDKNESTSASERRLRRALVAWNLLFFPVDSAYRLVKGIVSFFSSPIRYFWGTFRPDLEIINSQEIKEPETPSTWRPLKPALNDNLGRTHSFTTTLSRIFTNAATVLFILGFIGALVVPIPGIAPLYTAGALGIAQAIAIAGGCSLAARVTGGLLGSVIDFFATRHILNKMKGYVPVRNNNGNSAQGRLSGNFLTGEASNSFSEPPRKAISSEHKDNISMVDVAREEKSEYSSSGRMLKRFLTRGLVIGLLGETAYPLIQETLTKSANAAADDRVLKRAKGALGNKGESNLDAFARRDLDDDDDPRNAHAGMVTPSPPPSRAPI
jgi:hypothetical protein